MKDNDKIIRSNLKTLIKRFSKEDIISNIEKNYVRESVRFVDSDLIIDNSFLSKVLVNDESLKNVKESIKENGFYNPLIVRTNKNKYEVILGRKRYLASRLIGNVKIPIIVNEIDDEECLLTLLADCRERRNVSSYEIAIIMSYLKTMFKYKNKDLALILNQSPAQVSNLITILNLPQHILNDVSIGKLSYGHAKCIARLKKRYVEEVYGIIVEKSLSVRATEKLVNSYKDKNNLNKCENCKVFQKNNRIILEFSNEEDANKIKKIINDYIYKLK